MKRTGFVLGASGLLLAAASTVWAQAPAPDHVGDATAHLLELLAAVILAALFLLGSAAFALFWEGILEDKITRGISTLQTRPGASVGVGLGIFLGVIVLGKAAHGAPALGGLVVIVALLGLWLLALGLVCYARWVGQRFFADGARPALATPKGMVVVLLMGVVFPVGTFALLVLGISGLGAMALSWRNHAATPARSAPPAEGPLEM